MRANSPSSKLRCDHAVRLILGAMLCCTGCASLTGESSTSKKKKDSSWSWFKKKEYQLPQSMNVTWTHDIYTAEGKLPTRGFGGRIYFYNEKSQAIPVDGELTVYGFDDTHRDHSGMSVESADKKFKFTAEQFTTHFSESDLGASYSIWIPWDLAPGEAKKIMLIPTFRTSDGRLVKGKPASLLLPGPPGPSSENAPGEVIQVSAKGSASRSRVSPSGPTHNRNDANDGTPRTTTIQMPNRLQARPQVSPERAAALLQQAIEANRAQEETLNAAQQAAWKATFDTNVSPASAIGPANPGANTGTVPYGQPTVDANGVQVIDASPSPSAGWNVKHTTGAAIDLNSKLPFRQYPQSMSTPRPFGFTQPANVQNLGNSSMGPAASTSTSPSETFSRPHEASGSEPPRLAPSNSPTASLGR